jgi:hypothetical protein
LLNEGAQKALALVGQQQKVRHPRLPACLKRPSLVSRLPAVALLSLFSVQVQCFPLSIHTPLSLMLCSCRRRCDGWPRRRTSPRWTRTTSSAPSATGWVPRSCSCSCLLAFAGALAGMHPGGKGACHLLRLAGPGAAPPVVWTRQACQLSQITCLFHCLSVRLIHLSPFSPNRLDYQG